MPVIGEDTAEDMLKILSQTGEAVTYLSNIVENEGLNKAEPYKFRIE